MENTERKLIDICEFLGLDHTQWDDGVRKNSEGDE